MKKQIIRLSCMALVSSLVFSSCQKDDSTIQSNSDDLQMVTMSAPQFRFYEFGTEISENDFLKNPDDAKDEEYNKVEYALTLGLLEIYKNHSDILTQLIQKTNSTRNKCYNLFTFANEQSAINSIFNAIFASRFNDFGSYGNNWKSYVEAKYKYDVNYIPFVRFANQGQINIQQQPFIAAPFEIDEDKFPEFDDNIPMWIKAPEGIKFSTLNYENAKILTNPTILISNGHIGDEVAIFENIPGLNPSGTVQPMSCDLPTHVHEYITHTKFKINYRYESSKYSEYKFIYATTVGFNPSTFQWVNKYDEVKFYANGKKVHKNDIGKLLDFYFDVYTKDLYPNGSSSTPALCFDIVNMNSTVYQTYAVGAFELDWYAGMKKVLSVKNSAGTTLTYKDRRKFDNEWYFLDPSTNNSYPFNTRNPNPHTTYTNYNKGELRLHRWN